MQRNRKLLSQLTDKYEVIENSIHSVKPNAKSGINQKARSVLSKH